MEENIELLESTQELSTSIIEVDSVCFSYRNVKVLDDIHLQVEKGEFLVLMGPSGCGKSTLLRLLAGLEQPDSGEIFVKGVPLVGGVPDASVVFQDYSLFPWMSAKENIILALQQKVKSRQNKKELANIAEEYLELVQLGHAVNKYPGEMSGGMKQRAAIARALAFGSDLLLMDEPFGALDPLTRVNLQDLMLQISKEKNKTIVFVTHDADEAIYLADRIIMFSKGPQGVFVESVHVPFKKSKGREIIRSKEFSVFREHILSIMNKGLLDRLDDQKPMGFHGEGI